MTFTPTDGESDYFYMTAATVQEREGVLSRIGDLSWLWDPPTQPMPYTQPKPKEVTPPHLLATRTFSPFQGHKFQLGGSKK